MQYQVIRHLKTKSKKLIVLGTAKEAKQYIENLGARFSNYSYIGDFPVYVDGNKTYSVQGLASIGVVCSLPKEERSVWA